MLQGLAGISIRIMVQLILAIGLLIVLAGVTLIIKPGWVFDHLRRNLEHPGFHALAVTARLLLGVLLIFQADLSRHPLAIEILGWISLLAALSLALMGRRNFIRLVSWTLDTLAPYSRIGGALAAAFGAFLVYAYV